jgi:3-methyl-2-oxobutanoate hydroxymethyltransferase
MRHNRMTVADVRALKGRRKFSMLYVDTLDEASAASEAGIDMLSIIDPVWTPRMREAAGKCFVQVGLLYGQLVTEEDYLRAAFRALENGGDSFYCAASLKTVERLASEGLPVVGHVGLVPSKATWTGGFQAVGKTAESAMSVYRQVKDLENAGAFGAEIEVVPDRVAEAVSKRTSLVLLGMGAGAHADAQYLFAEDVLGYTRGHLPRHAKVYRDFKSEYARLQRERVAAFGEFIADVESGAYPAREHNVQMPDDEFEKFLSQIG